VPFNGGQIHFFKNEGKDETDGKPAAVPGAIARAWAADVNDDSKRDILLPDTGNLVSRGKGVSEEDFKKKHAELTKNLKEMEEKMPNLAEANKAEKMKTQEQMGAIMTEENTGLVWLSLWEIGRACRKTLASRPIEAEKTIRSHLPRKVGRVFRTKSG
jgi:hypothetical protein